MKGCNFEEVEYGNGDIIAREFAQEDAGVVGSAIKQMMKKGVNVNITLFNIPDTSGHFDA